MKKHFKRTQQIDVYENDQEQDKKLLARRGGGGGEIGRTMDKVESLDFDLEINPDDDEELDDDEAFNEEDEEKYGSFFNANDQASEKSDDDEADEGEYMDLSEMLDSNESTKTNNFKKIAASLMPTEESSDDDNNDFYFEEGSDEESEADEKSLEMVLQPASTGKKKRKREITEAFGESEFAVGSSLSSKKKLSIKDLTSVIDEEANFGKLKKQLSVKDAEDAKTLDAPLHNRAQDKISRDIAYDESKKMISKWTNIVKKNREADHLSFPMNEPPRQNLSSGAIVSQYEPGNDMEKEINDILIASGLTEDQQKKSEELELNKLSAEEVKKRMAELAKMRALMFFKEQKQKKIAKIKSRTFRKIHKKDQAKADVSIEEMQKLDPKKAQEMREKAEFDRIKERMTLKHKNMGKWAKSILGKKTDNDESQKAISEQLLRHQQLRKRIQGVDSEDEDAEEEKELEDVSNSEIVKAGLKNLESLKSTDREETTGIFAMKFMQKAKEKQQQEVDKEIKKAQRELEAIENGEEVYSSDENEANGAPGRQSFAFTSGDAFDDQVDDEIITRTDAVIESESIMIPAKGEALFKVDSFEELNENVYTANANGTNALDLSIQSHKADDISNSDEPSDREENNPWLAADGEVSKKSSKETKIVGKQQRALQKLSKKINDSRKEDVSDEPELELERPPLPTLAADLPLENSDEDSDYENIGMVHSSTLSNNDILRLAFANDDVFADFEEEKDEAIKQDGSKTTDVTLPGWGDWSGPGVKQTRKKPIIQTTKGIDESKRKDYKLKHVIINEKRQKKPAVKYMLPQLPHGFENREQYERTISHPIGKEWNTMTSHSNLSRPKVRTKLGAVINPIKFESSKKK